jgi:hypothetical protein
MTRLTPFLLLLILAAGCRKEPVTWRTDILAPIAKGRLDISAFVNEDALQTDADGLLYLSFKESLDNLNVDSLLNVLDTTINNVFTLGLPPGSITVPAGFGLFNINQQQDLAIEPIKMKYLRIKSGRLNYSVKNYFTAPISATYSIPSVTVNGSAFSISDQMAARVGPTPGSYSGVQDLAGAEFDLRGQNLNAHNIIRTVFNVAVASNAPEGTQINTADSVVIKLEFKDVVIEYARGFFGTHVVEDELTLPLDFMDKLDLDEVGFAGAFLSFDIKNYLGADIKLKINGIQAARDNQIVALNAQTLQSPILLPRAFDYGTWVQPSEFSTEITPDNSQILPFLGILPKQLKMNYRLDFNPLGDISGGHDFYYSENVIRADLEANLPLCLSGKGLLLRDTLDIATDFEYDVTGHLILKATNSFPFSALVSGSIVNNEGVSLHNFDSSGSIASGIFDQVSGNTSPMASSILISLGNASEHVKAGNRIALNFRFDTWNHPEIVKIKSDNYIDVTIIGDLNAKVEIP